MTHVTVEVAKQGHNNVERDPVTIQAEEELRVTMGTFGEYADNMLGFIDALAHNIAESRRRFVIRTRRRERQELIAQRAQTNAKNHSQIANNQIRFSTRQFIYLKERYGQNHS